MFPIRPNDLPNPRYDFRPRLPREPIAPGGPLPPLYRTKGGEHVDLGAALSRFTYGEPLEPLTRFQVLGAAVSRMFNGLAFETDEAGRIDVRGTEGDDVIEVRPRADGGAFVTVNGTTSLLTADEAQRITIRGGDGNDRIVVDREFPHAVEIHGGDGRDTLTGGAGDDVIRGGEGRDYVRGGDGNDMLRGGGARDFFVTGPGDDVVVDAADDELVF